MRGLHCVSNLVHFNNAVMDSMERKMATPLKIKSLRRNNSKTETRCVIIWCAEITNMCSLVCIMGLYFKRCK